MADKRIMTPEEKALLQARHRKKKHFYRQDTARKKPKQEIAKKNVMPEHTD